MEQDLKKKSVNRKAWTVMIYMAGDNNLSVDMAYAMEQIKGVAGDTEDSPNLFVYYDGNSSSIPTLYCDFSEPNDPKYVRSFVMPEKLFEVPKKVNENAADDKSIMNFIHWCVNQVEVEDENGEVTYGRRAKKYALIFSGHTLGFQDIGLFKDETSGKSMKMAELYFTLDRITKSEKNLKAEADEWKLNGVERKSHITPLLGQKIDVLGFDACVMGMLEVGYQFKQVAKTMIASEGSVPNAGWTYAKILGCLTHEDETDNQSNTVAERFVRDFIKSQDAFTVGGVSVDMAAWDLDRLDGLAGAFDDLSAALVDAFLDRSDRLYRMMQRAILHVHWQCQSYMYDQNVDLGDFCGLLDQECSYMMKECKKDDDDFIFLEDLQLRCRNVVTELRKAVILSGFSGGEYQYSNGVSVFFPWSREGYEVSKKNYESLWFTKDAASRKFFWSGFLKKYLYEVGLRKFEPTNPDAEAGQKYRYESGVRFHEPIEQELSFVNGDDIETKLAGKEGSKLAGKEGSKLAGKEGSKLAGKEGSKLAGKEGSKLAGKEGSKLAGKEGSKLAGKEGSKLAGKEGSKLAGKEGSKLAGKEGSKLAGKEGSKLAGGGSDAFFENLQLFKNIDSRWNVSGFTKKANEDDGPLTPLEIV